MDANPLVSVIIPSYNHCKYIGRAIQSVFDQTYKNIELIVIDDGSSDNSVTIVNAFCDISPIPMKFISKKNEGLSKTLNLGLEKSAGKWIAILSSDDYFAPEKIEEQIALSNKLGNDYACIHCDATMINENGEVIGNTYTRSLIPPMQHDCFFDFAFGKKRVIAPSVLIKEEVFQEIGFFDESLVAEDFDFHLRLSRVYKYGFVNKPLLYDRHITTSLGRSPRLWIHDGIKALAKHRDILGRRYHDALRVKCIRNQAVCLYNGYFSGYFLYIYRSFYFSRSANEIWDTLKIISATILGFYFKKIFSSILPQEVLRKIKYKFRKNIIN